MAHILCVTSGLTGILYASFKLARRLESAGHQITYACPKDVGDQVRANDLAYFQLPEINFFPAPEMPTFSGRLRRWRGLWYRIRHVRKRQHEAVTNLGMDAFTKALRTLKPDLVLIDVELHEHLMTSISSGVPTVLLSQWFSLWRRSGLPPLLHDTIPGVGWRGSRWGMSWAWFRICVHRWWIFQRKKWRSVKTDRRSVLKKYAHQIGFPWRYARENYWPGPITYDQLPVWSMTMYEMEFPHLVRPHLHYIGAQVLADRRDLRADRAVQDRLESLFAKREAEGGALIYASVSSFKAGDRDFLSRLVAAVRVRSDWMMILSLGGQLDLDFLGVLPDHVHVFSWVPQAEVLARADCSINHGGIHTINECVHFQVPMLVYSGKRSDQNGCAARVAYHGLGIMADKDKDDVEAIRANIDRILTDPRFRSRMAEMHGYYQKYGDDEKLSELVRVALSTGKGALQS